MSAAKLYQEAQAMAQAMLARAEAGSVISFMLPNWLEAATIYLGATLAGMVVNPILPSLRERELLFMLPDVESKMIFIPDQIRGHDYAAMLTAVCDQLDHPPEVIVVRGEAGNHSAYQDVLTENHHHRLPELNADAVQMIMYTSGTTGSPKGVMHSYNSIGALVRQLGQHWLIESGDKFLVPSPISHIGGSIYAFEIPILLGATAILMDRWDGEQGLQLLKDYRCTHMAGATPFLEQLLAAAQKSGSRLPDLKLFICGGASVPPQLIKDAKSQFDRAIITRVYGSTEVPVTTVGSLAPDDIQHAAETDGQAGIAEIRLASHANAVKGEGEIFARGPQMLVGYLHSEDEADVFDAEGFYRTGDLGRWVDDSYLLVSGRAKDIIIRKGENISPKEVEDLLLTHDDITEIAIVGVPDPQTGERACAVVVADADAKLDLAAITAFLKHAGVASFKLPEELHLWDALPKNSTGKILKHLVRATLISQRQER